MNDWSIGIYASKSILGPYSSEGVHNPVLTATDVDDVVAVFVADPFMVKKDSSWYMFFEVFNAESKNGEIGMATSEDGLRWKYEQIVLTESFHLSYPYVFESAGQYYMIPESSNEGSVRLYRAEEFPTK